MATWFHVTTGKGNPQGSGWAPGECIWSPSSNSRGSVAHYGIMREVRPGDAVVVCVHGQICGVASASSAYREVHSGPPESGPWSYARSFFKVDLANYVTFTAPTSISAVATTFKCAIRQDMLENRPTYYLYSWYPENEFNPGGRLVLGQGRFLARATPTLIDCVRQSLSSVDRAKMPPVSPTA